MTPFFSVVIPTLNEEDFLPKLLKSLCSQTDKDFEVIVADNQSKDKTREAALFFKDKLSIQLFENRGVNVAAQRNFGAKKAIGQYLIFLDADTGIKTSFIRKMKKVIDKRKGLVFIPYVNPMEKKTYPEMELIYPLINLVVEVSQNFKKALSAGGNMIWEKNFFNLIGGFDEKLTITEDHDIIRKAHLWGVKVQIIHSVEVKFSLRRMKREGRLRLFYKVLISHFHLFFNDKLEKKLFDYEMGGHLYKKKIIEKKPTFLKAFKKLLAEI